MRLIDADALKKKIESLVVGGAEGLKDYYENGSKSDENAWIGGVYDTWEQIDNAPTVDTDDSKYLEERDADAWESGYIQGLSEQRTHGEWGKWVISEIRCPNCLEYFDTDCYSKGELNKCPSCGADMRGKEE